MRNCLSEDLCYGRECMYTLFLNHTVRQYFSGGMKECIQIKIFFGEEIMRYIMREKEDDDMRKRHKRRMGWKERNYGKKEKRWKRKICKRWGGGGGGREEEDEY